MNKKDGPRILVLDIETFPILGNIWGLFDQNVSIGQIEKDWSLLSWSAKWLGDPENKVMYMDQRRARDINNDKAILKGIWKLLDECDIVLGHNVKQFDCKKLNARFALNGMDPPSSYKVLDTLTIARRHFSFTSNKLEYLSDKLCTKYKKLKHKKYPGYELWKECYAKNKDAFKEMEKYNKHDVFSTEEVYNKLKPWDNTINFNLYSSSTGTTCSCGASSWVRNGYAYTAVAKYQRYKCRKCSSEIRDRKNLLDKDKKESLKSGTTR